MKDAAIPEVPWTRPLPAAALPAVAVVRRLREAGHEAYLVGGAIRDLLRGGEPGDFDVATDAPPERVEALFARTEPVGRAFGVVLVVEGGAAVQTATFRTEGDYVDARHPGQVAPAGSVAEDAARRDFTVNALYLDPVGGRLLDPVGGLADAKGGVLRAVGDPGTRFGEDALRLLRAPRLAAAGGLAIEPATLAAVRRHAARLRLISAERIGHEIELIVTGPAPAAALRLLDETGLLALVLPEAAAMRGIPQPPEHHPEGDVWTHTLLAFEASARPRSLALGLAILLHDAGKPATLRWDGRLRCHGHAALGTELTVAAGARLRLDGDATRRAASLVRQHLRPADIERMRQATRKRFLRQPEIEELLELHRLDRLASNGDLRAFEACRRFLRELRADELRPAPLLDGRDLQAMGYPPGPLLGRILRQLEVAQLEGLLGTRQEAEAWVRRRFSPEA